MKESFICRLLFYMAGFKLGHVKEVICGIRETYTK